MVRFYRAEFSHSLGPKLKVVAQLTCGRELSNIDPEVLSHCPLIADSLIIGHHFSVPAFTSATVIGHQFNLNTVLSNALTASSVARVEVAE